MWGIDRWPVNSLHKWPVTWKLFSFDDIIMFYPYASGLLHWQWSSYLIAPVPVRQPWGVWIWVWKNYDMVGCCYNVTQYWHYIHHYNTPGRTWIKLKIVKRQHIYITLTGKPWDVYYFAGSHYNGTWLYMYAIVKLMLLLLYLLCVSHTVMCLVLLNHMKYLSSIDKCHTHQGPIYRIDGWISDNCLWSIQHQVVT